jgi:predicted unusual protein kinase regulating ubiquinone biosynthesis (AarF/ABC1/UbiB family)
MSRRQLRRRYLRIIFFGSRLTISFIWWGVVLRRVLGQGFVQRGATSRLQRFAREFRELAVDMGGVLIKMGQMLSARVDILPPEVTSELAGLQDEVPPEQYAEILAVVEKELGPVDQFFEFFDKNVQAAASLGQVHRARLIGGESVVVKVQRPGIEELINVDLAAVRTVARWVGRYPAIRRRMDLPGLLDEFARTLYEELDYLAEARNAETFAANFASDPFICVPVPYWTHTTRRVLTLEDVNSIKIVDFDAIDDAGIDRGAVAHRLFQAYLQQVFYDGFFHADPHPGNLFIHPLDWGGDNGGLSGRPFLLVFVDFGMVGHITPAVKRHLRELTIGLGTRDASRATRAFERLGFLLPSADLELLERAMSRAFDQFWGISMGELAQLDHDDFRAFANEFRDLLYAMPFQVPQDFVYLGRMFGMLSGLATQLDPDFNVFAESEPFARQLLNEELADGRGWEILRDEITQWGRTVWGLPAQLQVLLNKSAQGDLEFRVSPDREWRQATQRIDTDLTRLLWGMGGSALLLTGVVLGVNGQADVARWLYGGAGLALLRVVWLGRQWV